MAKPAKRNPAKKYDFAAIEKRWRAVWLARQVFEPNLKSAPKPFYNLMMFPYPSAEGLHVGNMYAFTGSDIYGRLKRMQGHDVFEPIGLDGFGIHSENYALKMGKHPMAHAKESEKNFYRQLGMIGNGFAWRQRLETYDPAYYKWTQWIFTHMFKAGLAYRKKQAVNWCPSCKTVLADEQVVAGECERCGSKVIKRELEQWFFRITRYADRLLKNLAKLDWSEKVKIAQRNWIGESIGATIEFRIQNSAWTVPVFTTRPDTLFGATYLVLAPEHPLVEELKARLVNRTEVEAYVNKARHKSEEERISLDKTGVELKGAKAVNPANREEIPIWVADYVLASYGTGAIMAVPAHDARDFEFARKFHLSIRRVISPDKNAAPASTAPPVLNEGNGYLIDSDKFTGLESEAAKRAITEFVGGENKVQYRLRDWLIYRQRYWGPPIPMIYCENCALARKGERADMPGWYTVPDKDLPVKLPRLKDVRPTGTNESPLAAAPAFVKVRCPGCARPARRETDVSDTFLDSAWYYLGYLAKENSKIDILSSKFKHLALKWLPVDMYIGGAEHAVLHLLYVRFLALALQDIGALRFTSKGSLASQPAGASGGEEPFRRFRAHGLLIKEGTKMSKSKGNVVNPDEYIRRYGADALRMYLMFLSPFEQGGDFRDQGILGITRFLDKVWKFSQAKRASKKEAAVERALQRTIKKVTEDIEALRYNTAISALMILLAEMEARGATLAQWTIFLKLLAPFAPFMAEEIWHAGKTQSAGRKTFRSVHREKWPKFDVKLVAAETFTLIIQVNGKLRDSVEVPAGISEAEAEERALESERVKTALGARPPKRIIYVPGRLVNVVV